ncbi:type I-C CRISPR-associated protein Cas8c/Csd1 [Paenibacillus sp. S150]|nr:type I-C CRISPR-associated protein Cas8c/Csd1 [Paenibacillus sp. S150]
MKKDRSEVFGRLIAIANVLGDRVNDKGEVGIAASHLSQLGVKPAQTLERLHRDLMEHAHQFGEAELVLLDMFGELMAELDVEDFTNEPLKDSYVHAYHTQQHALNNVMGVEEAAKLWDLAPGTIKNYCLGGKVVARKIGKTWVIDRNQPNPKQSNPPPME